MTPNQEHDDTNADAPDERHAPTDGGLRPDARRWVEPSRSGRTAIQRPDTPWILGSSTDSEEPELLRWCQIV